MILGRECVQNTSVCVQTVVLTRASPPMRPTEEEQIGGLCLSLPTYFHFSPFSSTGLEKEEGTEKKKKKWGEGRAGLT